MSAAAPLRPTHKGPDAPAAQPEEGWQVPAYTVALRRPKRRDTCVVIPVINEGERIGRLLRKIAACGAADAADVIVVDGGSQDGSLAEPVLAAGKVSALLQKTGPGKLSAQLRCAYAFALRAGYTGVVTIDGNDKDDPAAILSFIARLEAGGDFVQASRYLAGGVAQNVPKGRDLAIRCIHAPLLRWASGFPWTDTTQGFRGYSRRLLTDERLAIFRDIFVGYELLAYLSYRAPRLGFHCEEAPTTRCYPMGEIPSKISGWRGHADLLKVLLAACCGYYNPRTAD